MIFAKKKRIPILILVAISLCGSLQPTVADRDVGDQMNYLKRLLDKRAEKKKKKIEEKQQQRQQPNQYPYDHIGQTTTTKSGNSLLARSFILACMFWTIKLAMPHISRYIARLCRDITQFRRSLRHRSKELHRRRKKTSHVDEETPSRRKNKSQSSKKEDTERRDRESISPSVLSIIEMGKANDDDGSSFISATSSITSVSTFFSQIARSRRRKPKQKSTEGAESTSNKHTKSKQSSSSSKSSSRSKKKSHNIDVEKGITKSKLHFIEEEHDTTETKHGNDTNDLDDISHLPIVGNIKKPEDGYGLLERKVSNGSDKKHSSHGKKWHR